jgi:hypothetical protein
MRVRSPSPISLSPPLLSSVREKRRRQEGDEEEDAAAHGDVLVVGLERLTPPDIKQVFEADADADDDSRAHRSPCPKLSRAERIAVAKAQRAAAADVITSSSLGLCLRLSRKRMGSGLVRKGRSGGGALGGRCGARTQGRDLEGG